MATEPCRERETKREIEREKEREREREREMCLDSRLTPICTAIMIYNFRKLSQLSDNLRLNILSYKVFRRDLYVGRRKDLI